MSHSVHFRDVAGEVHLEDVASLEAALERVEYLRNDDDATEVRVFREVPIEVRTYYRVTAAAEPVATPPVPDPAEGTELAEFAAPPADAGVPAPDVEPPSGAMVMSRPPVAATAEATPADDAEVPAETHEGRRLFSRS